MKKAALLSLSLSIAITAACSVVQVGPRGSTMGDGDRRLPSPQPRDLRPTGTEMHRGCRGQRVSGYVAVDYVADTLGCPSGTKHYTYGTAIMIRLATQPKANSLVVCADQPVPNGWIIVQKQEQAGQCPEEPGSTRTLNVMEIKRQ